MKIRTRFAPSPTGFLHVGGLRTALYNYLFAKNNKGDFLLRIEDTDQKRIVAGSQENIIQTLVSLGITPDEKPLLQSERLDIYKKYAEKLVSEKKAYLCFCTEERLAKLRELQNQRKMPTRYDGTCRDLSEKEMQKFLEQKTPFVIRQKIPLQKNIQFHDLIRGDIQINTDSLDDQIILKSDGWPTYHLASVVDDHEMKISHIIRGEEWLPSTPKHIILYEYFDWEKPQFAHLPLLLNPDKSKLSKRQGDVAVRDYLNNGYLPHAFLNFILLLGWNPGDEREVFSLEEMIKIFSLERVHKAGAVFNLEKLDWLNGLYIRKTQINDLVELSLTFFQNKKLISSNPSKEEKKLLRGIVATEQLRIKKISDLPEFSDFYFHDIEYSHELLLWKKQSKEQAAENLKLILKIILEISEKNFTKKNLEEKIFQCIQEKKLKVGDTLWPLRVALSGKKASPGPFEIAEVMGKEKVILKIEQALKKII